jgi:outer membrane beta-barrel protein
MKKTRFGLLAAAALWAVPTASWAQDADEDADAIEEGVEDGVDDDGADDIGDDIGIDDGGSGLGDICEIDPEACPTLKMEEEAAKPLNEKIIAVQQRFIIKKNRFELQPYWSLSLNDQFVGHPGPGLAVNYYITEALAVGINGNYYGPFNTDQEFNAQVRRAARVGVPLTEYDWGAALNFTYVPANGKFAGFGDFIFHYDFYVVGGVGAISTRPIPVIEPEYRIFEFEPKLAFNAGLGLKVFVNRWFAGFLEVRDYVFLDKLENLEDAQTSGLDPRDKSHWLGDSSLTNNVQLQIGASIFIPFSFEYRLPKAGADTTAAQ